MKRILSIILIMIIVFGLFIGCQTNEEQVMNNPSENQGGQDSTTAFEQDSTTDTENELDSFTESTNEQVSTQPESEEITDKSEVSEPDNEEKTEKPESSGSVVSPSGSTETEPPEIENDQNDENILAGGDWDFGPVKWEITNDGVLTISGNKYIQGKAEYIWKDYSDIITRVVISDGITSIPENAFSEMTNITSVYLGNAVQKIDDYAFYGCTGLQSVTMPKYLKTIGEYCFARCLNLQTISFTEGGNLHTIGEYAFYQSGLREFRSPSSLRTIEANAFLECTQLESLYLEGGVSEIKAKAFKDCTGLKYVVLGASITQTGGYVFDGCKAFVSVETYTSNLNAFADQFHLTTVVIGGERTYTGTFTNCSALTSVTILAPITMVTGSAFRGCTSLTSITLPDTVTTIEGSAFRKTGIKKISIPASVTSIGVAAFTDSALEEITFIGDPPRIVNSNGFTNVTATVYYPADNELWTEEVRQNFNGNLTWVAY